MHVSVRLCSAKVTSKGCNSAVVLMRCYCSETRRERSASVLKRLSALMVMPWWVRSRM